MDDSPFPVRGIIEGFYGVYYTWPERTDLIRFIGQHGFNHYIYAPKDDWHHRQRWWQPYPARIMAAFSDAAASAEQVGVQFCYALHCSLPPEMSPAEAVTAIRTKLQALYGCGVRAFSLLFDDLDLTADIDPAELLPQAATTHAMICNDVAAWLHQLDARCTLSMCPTEYAGRTPFSSYLHTLGALLDRSIAMFYTGPQICSPTISCADVAGFAEAAGRPPLVWDNYPVNDLAMQSELHLSPIHSRDSALASVTAGIVINPMLQAEASKIPLLTYAAYLADPQHYDPQRAWSAALDAVAGSDSAAALRQLAGYTACSCLDSAEPQPLIEQVQALLLSWRDEQPELAEAALQALSTACEQLREDCYHLKYHLTNLRLRENLLPWILALEAQLALARHAVRVLECRAQRRDEQRTRRQLASAIAELAPQPKRVRTAAFDALLSFVQALPLLTALPDGAAAGRSVVVPVVAPAPLSP